MDIAQRRVDGVMVVDVSGRLTAAENPGRLKDKVTSLIFQGEKRIVINLAGTSYIDSAGLGEIVACYGSAVRNGAEVKLANLDKRVRDLLVMTKLYTIFDCHDSEEAAIRSFATAAS